MTACLSSISIAFYDILAQTYVTIKILRCESDLRAVIGPLMGLPAVKKLQRKRPQDKQILPSAMAGNFALSFSLNFLCLSQARLG